MSGLTVGYLSIDKLDLEIKQAIGTEQERKAVQIILNHQLLIGSNNLANIEITSFLISNFTSLQCVCNGSASYLPR